ncbi:MAG: cupin protein [Microbacteriaceae bacterium]|jgi:quercetin dioxygenase-like cupin family protein|nr:cupin protein [Microbacteriaceae bacterium]
MQKVSLTALARQELKSALDASSGRSASTIYGGHERRLRQTVIALRAGESLSEHQNPGEATLQVLIGRVTLRSGEIFWNGSPGDVMILPEGMHSVDAEADSVVLLTVVKLISDVG